MSKVLVIVSGGNIQNIITTKGVDVHVIDYDNIEAGDKAEDANNLYPSEEVTKFENRLKREIELAKQVE